MPVSVPVLEDSFSAASTGESAVKLRTATVAITLIVVRLINVSPAEFGCLYLSLASAAMAPVLLLLRADRPDNK